MLGVFCGGLMLLARGAWDAPTWSGGGFPANPNPATYSQAGLSTWDTTEATPTPSDGALPTGAGDWPVRYRINLARNESATMSTVTAPASLTHPTTGDTLKTYWWFDGSEASGNKPGWTPSPPASQGYLNPVLGSAFMTGVGVQKNDVNGGPSNFAFQVVCRGINNENSGSSSDLTEAPDTGTYTTSLTLRMTY